jgi:hypothetical protein
MAMQTRLNKLVQSCENSVVTQCEGSKTQMVDTDQDIWCCMYNLMS